MLLKGKKVLVLGLANEMSMAWSIASRLHQEGAEFCFTWLNEALKKRVEPLAEKLGCDFTLEADVTRPETLDNLFEEIKKRWGKIDYVLHSLAFSDKSQLEGRYVDTTLDNFLLTMNISAFSLVDICKRVEPLMTDGGSIVCMTYMGSEKVMPNYNVMGVAKAALECSVRYLANDLGVNNIRVNAISAGPMRTLAASGVSDLRLMLDWTQANAPLRRNVSQEDIGGIGLFYLSDLSSGVTGEVTHCDCGINIMNMPQTEYNEQLKPFLKDIIKVEK